MKIKPNTCYEFKWEDHYAGEYKGYAREFYHWKSFKSEEMALQYISNMKAGNKLLGILEQESEYDALLMAEDGEGLENYRSQNTFII